MASIEEVRSQLDRLNGLMADPQPGLFAWKMAFGSALDDFCEYGKERDKQRELKATIAEQAATIERFRAFGREWDRIDNSNTLVCYQREPTRQSWGIHGQRWGGLLDGIRNARAAITDEDMGDAE